MDDENTDQRTLGLEEIAEQEARRQRAEHDDAMTRQLARAIDPQAWDPELGMREGQRRPAELQWGVRRLIALDHAQNALPWVQQQCLAAYQEGVAAVENGDAL